MQKPEEFEAVATSLRELALAGASVPLMLRFVKQTVGSRPVAAAVCFPAAFSAHVAEVSAVCGWFDNQLGDERVAEIVLPVVTKWLRENA